MAIRAAGGVAGFMLAVLLATAAGATEVNTASQAELERIKGIGPALSQRLLDERAKAPFQDWADLLRRAGGIKAAAAAKLSAAGLTVNGGAYSTGDRSVMPAER